MSDEEGLQGIALKMYIILVNANKPLGPRELTRLADLSSPSVAYRNLVKLEELGLVEKDAYGSYLVSHHQTVKGHFWLSGRLYPRMVFYVFFFVGLLIVEAVLAATRIYVGAALSYDFVLLIIVTSTALMLFLLEGIHTKVA